LGKITNLVHKGEINENQKINDKFVYKAIKFEYQQLFEGLNTEEIQEEKQCNMEETEKEARNTNKFEEIFNTSATYNVEEENLERKFRHTYSNVNFQFK
jgi:hypothetical protein